MIDASSPPSQLSCRPPRWWLSSAQGTHGSMLGGPLLRGAFSGGDLARLTDRARQLSALVAEAVQARDAR